MGLLKGKSIERILSELEGLSDNEKIEFCIKYNMLKYLPRNNKNICVYDGIELDLFNRNIIELPENLMVNGFLSLTHNQLTSLPKNLEINGSLYCSHNQLTKINKNLFVKKDFHCNSNNLTEFPDDLIVIGDLVCNNQKNCNKLKLPKTAQVGGRFIN